MNEREQRGLVIAALCKLNKNEKGWLVPSQSCEKIYCVNIQEQTCDCPDHQTRGCKCKHLYAVEFTMKRETDRGVTRLALSLLPPQLTYAAIANGASAPYRAFCSRAIRYSWY